MPSFVQVSLVGLLLVSCVHIVQIQEAGITDAVCLSAPIGARRTWLGSSFCSVAQQATDGVRRLS